MGSEAGGNLPILVSLKRHSQEVGEKARIAAINHKRIEISSAQPAHPSTRRPFEELLTALRKVEESSIFKSSMEAAKASFRIDSNVNSQMPYYPLQAVQLSGKRASREFPSR